MGSLVLIVGAGIGLFLIFFLMPGKATFRRGGDRQYDTYNEENNDSGSSE